LVRLRSHCFKVFNLISNKPVSNDKDLIQFRINSQKNQFQALKQLQFSPPLFKVAGNPFFANFLISKHNFKIPNLELPPYLRCDIPIKEQSLFKQHQDYSYNNGSTNSVTIWIPLQDVNIDNGALLIASGTHKDGIYKNINGTIDDSFEFAFEAIPVKFGQAIIFDQKIVHKSGFNSSDIVRFSILLRYSDLADKDYLKRGFPLNHEIINKKFS